MLLIGKDIKIRDFEETDFPQYFELVQDKNNHDLAGLEYTDSEQTAHELFELYRQRKDAHVIATQNNNIMIGIIEMNHRGEYSGLSQTREIGFVIDQKYRQKGYATESVRLIINYGFKELHLREIWASTEENNKVPQTVLKKLKFKYVYSADQALPFAERSNIVKYYLLQE